MDFLPLTIDGKKVYAGFSKRFVAALVDVIIMYALLIPIIFSRKYGYVLAIVNTVLSGCLGVAYSVFLNHRWGGTVGKRLAGIKITRPNGTRIGWTEAWMRSSVDVLYSIVFLYAFLTPLLQIDQAQFSWAPIAERHWFFEPHRPSWYHFATGLIDAWFWSELLVLLFNKRKRALHDFIARTVVIDDQFAWAEPLPVRTNQLTDHRGRP